MPDDVVIPARVPFAMARQADALEFVVLEYHSDVLDVMSVAGRIGFEVVVVDLDAPLYVVLGLAVSTDIDVGIAQHPALATV